MYMNYLHKYTYKIGIYSSRFRKRKCIHTEIYRIITVHKYFLILSYNYKLGYELLSNYHIHFNLVFYCVLKA